MCLEGASRAGADLLAAMPNPDLRAHFVWVPMLPADDETNARAATQRFAEPRSTHYWDGDRHLARQLATTLAIDTRRATVPGDDPPFAWDVYLAYRRGNTNIEAPDFWMHQLAVEHAPRFEAAEWTRRVLTMLDESGT
jgi:hypothetical protein